MIRQWLAGGGLSLALCLSGCGYVVRIPYANLPILRNVPAYTQAPTASPSEAPISKRAPRR